MAEGFSINYDTTNEKTKLLKPEDQNGAGQKSMYSEDQNDIELGVIPSNDQNGRTQEVHCMVCRKSKKIKNFDALCPGDHIEMSIKKELFGCTVMLPIKHHAIVQEIIRKPEQGGATHSGGDRPHKDAHIAQVMVIDVGSKKEEYTLKSRDLGAKNKDTSQDDDKNKSQDIDKDMGKDKVQDNDEDKGKGKGKGDKDKDHDTEINCKISKIKKVEYRRRRNTHDQTLENAKSFVTNKEGMYFGKKYRLLLRNCEHFCVAMVNRDAEKDEDNNIGNASSLQSTRCFWASFHIVLSIFQCICFVFNFYLYAVYAQGNERYNHAFGNTSTYKLRVCYTGNHVRGFKTICDWAIFVFLLFVYAIAYIGLLCIQRTRGRNVCNQCKITARIFFITKMIFFALIETFNIFGEKYLYLLINFINTGQTFTWFFIIFLSLLELWLVFFVVPHFVVKHLVKRCLKCCECRSACCSQLCSALCCYPWDFDEDSYKYVIHYA